MTVRTIFASEFGNQPATQLDDMFADCWNGAPISCTATGINTIVLTANTNYGAPAAYFTGQWFSFKAAATPTGLVTVQFGFLAALPLYLPAQPRRHRLPGQVRPHLERRQWRFPNPSDTHGEVTG